MHARATDPESIYEMVGDQPEEIREVMIYVICQAMEQSGLLELVGASNEASDGTVLMYRNPDSNRVFEITKPVMAPEDEQAMLDDLRRLLASDIS